MKVADPTASASMHEIQRKYENLDKHKGLPEKFETHPNEGSMRKWPWSRLRRDTIVMKTHTENAKLSGQVRCDDPE